MFQLPFISKGPRSAKSCKNVGQRRVGGDGQRESERGRIAPSRSGSPQYCSAVSMHHIKPSRYPIMWISKCRVRRHLMDLEYLPELRRQQLQPPAVPSAFCDVPVRSGTLGCSSSRHKSKWECRNLLKAKKWLWSRSIAVQPIASRCRLQGRVDCGQQRIPSPAKYLLILVSDLSFYGQLHNISTLIPWSWNQIESSFYTHRCSCWTRCCSLDFCPDELFGLISLGT